MTSIGSEQWLLNNAIQVEDVSDIERENAGKTFSLVFFKVPPIRDTSELEYMLGRKSPFEKSSEYRFAGYSYLVSLIQPSLDSFRLGDNIMEDVMDANLLDVQNDILVVTNRIVKLKFTYDWRILKKESKDEIMKMIGKKLKK